MTNYRIQKGEVFHGNDKGEFVHIPRTVTQNGRTFEFNDQKRDFEDKGPAKDEFQDLSQERAAKVFSERGATFGARPTVLGLGAGAGSIVGNLQEGRGLVDSLKEGKKDFKEARGTAIREQDALEKANPWTAAGSDFAGGLLYAPLTGAKTIFDAVKLGLVSGAGTAIGEAESAGGAAAHTLAGGVLGGVIPGAIKGGQKIYEGGKTLAAKVFPTRAALKLAHATTNVPESDIYKYATEADEINKLYKEFAGNVPEAVDELRKTFEKKLKETKRPLQDAIENALSTVKEKSDVSTVIDALKEAQGKLHPIAKRTERQQIQKSVDLIKEISNGEKETSFVDLFAVYDTLMDQSKQVYKAVATGHLFADPGDIARALNKGYLKAKDILDKVSPEVKAANQRYHELHQVDDHLKSNLLGQGKPDGPLLAAGAGLNTRNANTLENVGGLVGFDILNEAKKISAMRSLGSAKLLPGPDTGHAVPRAVASAAVVGFITNLIGGDPTIGSMIGASLVSPYALKKIIDTGRFGIKSMDKAVNALNNPKFQSALIQKFGKDGLSKAQDNLYEMRELIIGRDGLKDITLPRKEDDGAISRRLNFKQ